MFFYSLQNSRLPLISIVQILYCFGMDMQVFQCEKLVPEIDQKSIIEWYDLFRGVCSHSLLHDRFKLGGGVHSEIIEIDESLFGKKRKYHRGTGNQKYWVFGMIERGTKNCHLQLVEKRDRGSLIPIIKQHVEEGSTIYSDEWRAYWSLPEEGYNHDKVNHTKEFVSETGCCTNTIEGLWGLVKGRIKKMKGVQAAKLPALLDEFMFRHRYGLSNGDIFHPFIDALRKYEN